MPKHHCLLWEQDTIKHEIKLNETIDLITTNSQRLPYLFFGKPRVPTFIQQSVICKISSFFTSSFITLPIVSCMLYLKALT